MAGRRARFELSTNSGEETLKHNSHSEALMCRP